MPMLFVRYCKNFQSLIFTEAVPYAVIYGEKKKVRMHEAACTSFNKFLWF